VNEGSRARHCPREDECIAVFLDGDPRGLDAELETHLEACPFCRRALDRARRIDALLAANTDTECGEAEADRLLAFLDEVPRDRGGAPRAREERPARTRVLVLGLAAAGVLCAFLLRGRFEERASVPERALSGKPPADSPVLGRSEPRNEGGRVRLAERGRVLVLPRLTGPMPALFLRASMEPSFEDLLAGRGRVDSFELDARARSLLASLGKGRRIELPLPAARPAAGETPPALGPLSRSEASEECVAAAQWLFRESRGGTRRDFALLVRALAAAPAPLRVRMSEELRRAFQEGIPAARRRALLRARDPSAAGLAGALGLVEALPALVRRSAGTQRLALLASRRVRSPWSLAFRIAWFTTSVQRRGKAEPFLQGLAFEGLPPAETRALRARLEALLRRSGRFEMRRACADLLARISGFEGS